MEKNKPEELKMLMEHPVFIMHDSSAKVVRAQLFFMSVSTILLVSSGVTVGEGSSILGVKLEGLTLHHVLWVLTFLISYQMFHFLWCSWDSFCEWRLRQSALGAGGWGGGGISILEEDQSSKVRQTTLYKYMVYVLGHDLKNIRKKVDGIAKEGDDANLKELKRSVDSVCEALESPRIDDSIWRFDNFFRMFCKSQTGGGFFWSCFFR